MPKKLDELSKRLRPSVDRSAHAELKKIQEKYKKEANMPTKKKESTSTPKSKPIATDLDEIVALKKKKAVANELDELIYEQEQKKKARESFGETPITQETKESPITELFTKSPEKLEQMSEDSIMKLAMLMSGNKGGGLNPLTMMLLMGQNQKEPTQILDLVNALKVMKEMNKEEGIQGTGLGGNTELTNTLIIWLLQQNMQKAQQQISKPDNSRELTAELIKLINQQNNLQRQMLLDKIKELEQRAQPSDPLMEATKVIEYFKSFRTLFGGAQTSESMEHERELKKMDWEQQKEARKMAESDKRLEQVGNLIDRSVGAFADALSKPVSEAVQKTVEKIGKGRSKTTEPPVDIDDLEDELYNQDIPIPEELGDYPLPEPKRRKKSRFTVHTTDGEEDI